VEASLYDSNWGIGLIQNDPRSLQRKTWRGKNRLGEILTDLRDTVFLQRIIFNKEHNKDTPLLHVQEQLQDLQQHIQQTQQQNHDTITIQPKIELFTFFNGVNSIYHQEYITIFTVSGFTYNCVEPFRQHRKALLFDDDVRAAQILETTKPNEQTRLGLKVTHFVPKLWSNINNVIMHEANYHKFTQNKNLEQELLATAGTTIAQACPFRGKYCTGYYATEPNCQKRRSWSGDNILGQILTNLRDEIIFKLNQ